MFLKDTMLVIIVNILKPPSISVMSNARELSYFRLKLSFFLLIVLSKR